MALRQTSVDGAGTVSSLRRLYLLRTIVQIAWAVAIFMMASASAGVTILLVVLYPLWDVACTAWDLRESAEPSLRGLQIANVVLGVAAAVAVGVLGRSDLRYAVVVFGVWALLAGLVQLGVGLARRRRLRGQWPMMLSGAQSTVVGGALVAGGLAGKVHVKDLGGYAVLGGVYFLVAALLLFRGERGARTVGQEVRG